MNGESTKTCPFCAEKIQATAKICPWCRRWLSLCSFRHPVVSIIVGVGMMLVFVAYMFRLMDYASRMFNPPPYYYDFLGSLQIEQSQMFFKDTTNGPRIYITGMLTNQSPIAWHEIEFECRFFGTNDNLIDAYTARWYGTVQARDDGAFRVTVLPVRDFKEYVNMKLFISDARNVKSPF